MRFAGYAAVFDRADRGGDVVRAGAFARALKRGVGAVPLLWQHDAARPIGRIEYLREDNRGLRVIARLAETRGGREAGGPAQGRGGAGAELRLPGAGGER
jgi:HK97 family phage prohead protease